MNFLSHYYFDKHTTDCYIILGTVLPDLLKNADKTVVLHPEKLVHKNPAINAIIQGWNKHLLVDKFFHSSVFFVTHSHQLKNELKPAIAGSPVKPFFVGHIAIELILDNLLLTTNEVNVDDFYDHLDKCDKKAILQFLQFTGMHNPAIFFKFFNEFKKSRYLSNYESLNQVTYALKRICMRVWSNPFTAEQEKIMTGILLKYRTGLFNIYKTIYEEITLKMG